MGLFSKKPNATVESGRRRPMRSDLPVNTRSAQAFSYYSQRSDSARNTGRGDQADDSTVRIRAPESRAKSWLLNPFGLMLMLAIGGYLTYLQPDPVIMQKSEEASAYFLQDKEIYRQAAGRVLEASLLNRFKVTADTAGVERALLDNYPELQSADVVVPLVGQKPRVVIGAHRPSFVMTTANNGAFLLDSTGRALTSASQVPDIADMKLPSLRDNTGHEVKLGSRALPTSTVSFAETVMKGMKSGGINTATLTLPSAYELDVAVPGSQYLVKFNTQADALQQTGTYLAVRDRLAAGKVVPKEYIDVRVSGRAYYK